MLIICNHRPRYTSPLHHFTSTIYIPFQLSIMKSNTILACSLIIIGVVAATEWETTYARYHHRNLSKAGKASSTGSKSTKSPTVITSSGSKSSKGSGSKGSGSKSSKSSGQTLTLEVSYMSVSVSSIAKYKSNIFIYLSLSFNHPAFLFTFHQSDFFWAYACRYRRFDCTNLRPISSR